MKFTCNTEGCPKRRIILERGDCDGSEPIDCMVCGEACELNPKEEYKPGEGP